MGLAFVSRRPRLALIALGIAAAACSSGNAPSASVSSAVSPSASLEPSPTPKPIVAPRPTDLPTDGACEEGYACLGLLEPGTTYEAETFQPAFHFQVPSSDWENLSMERGLMVLHNLAHPGDVIAFFRDPRAIDEEGLVPDVGASAEELADWLEANPQLEVTPAKRAKLGGLPAIVLEARVADDASSGPSDCPTQVCVPLFQGSDREAQPPWRWDWGFTQSENARIFLVTSKDGVVAVFVDANDATTHDSLNAAADQILRTLKFE